MSGRNPAELLDDVRLIERDLTLVQVRVMTIVGEAIDTLDEALSHEEPSFGFTGSQPTQVLHHLLRVLRSAYRDLRATLRSAGSPGLPSIIATTNVMVELLLGQLPATASVPSFVEALRGLHDPALFGNLFGDERNAERLTDRMVGLSLN